MRTLIDSESSERRSEDFSDSESESVSANKIFRASSALYEALRLSFDVLFLSETQQILKIQKWNVKKFSRLLL